MPSKQISRSQMDAIIYKVGGISQEHHDEVREALGGTLYSGKEGNLRERLLALQGKGILSESKRHAIQEAVFPE